MAKQVVPSLPKHERYRLGDQFLRAARSTTANIAGGTGVFVIGQREILQQSGNELIVNAIRLLNGYSALPEARQDANE